MLLVNNPTCDAMDEFLNDLGRGGFGYTPAKPIATPKHDDYFNANSKPPGCYTPKPVVTPKHDEYFKANSSKPGPGYRPNPIITPKPDEYFNANASKPGACYPHRRPLEIKPTVNPQAGNSSAFWGKMLTKLVVPTVELIFGGSNANAPERVNSRLYSSQSYGEQAAQIALSVCIGKTIEYIAPPIGQVLTKAKLNWKHRQLINTLKQGDVVASQGLGRTALIGELTIATGKEVALLRLTGGTRVLRLGTKNSVSAAGAKRVIEHSHPGGTLKFSPADELTLQYLGQRSSLIIAPRSKILGRTRFDPERAKRLVVPPATP
jgi:hypothetical protein